MTDRIKESLFSALEDVGGLTVLDLYAGSGSLGLEALSRGAATATFVENARDAIVKLEENIASTGLGGRAEVLWADASQRVDLIFLDPPYSTSPQSVLADLETLVTGGWLADEGRVVLHRPSKERKLQPFGLKVVWEREYGQSVLSIFTHEDEDG
jgi:16S rRNA (guanine966-N2)-methyltransferase